ncbi:FtsQ-type POTRA domain-containing protein [Microbacterium imperiale]|uniref:FtsQ-type POTRA domain-containing protein n=1 Tax=Microbacterium imperiale TaxID=33884 RepID=UPI001AE77FF0|nr:FtsQ-type POTRA domain-containing protein [Microbacterium imperiale]MBP2419918.1 cell division protein FtsQ [Microbacterium imperiale]MDS0198218.1 FtsQ-type POTRA domain-containing protein [Microbacterium imperiale]
MRRPSPLPPPSRPNGTRTQERGDTERSALTPRRVDPPRRDASPAAAGDQSQTQPLEPLWDQRGRDYGIAPIIPFDSPTRPADASLSDEHASGDTGDTCDTGDTGDTGDTAKLTPRDVWSAARERRRALRREVRRFTARQRRRRRVWIVSLSIVAALVLGSVGAAYSPLFSVERVTVVGTTQLDAGAVQSALADQLGTPMPLIDESAIKAALVSFPLVESYSLEARPPHELIVRIVERTPVGAVQGDAGYTLVDAAGVALSTTPEPPAGHPLLEVEGGLTSPTFAAAGQVFRALPEDLRAQVTTVSATTPNDVTLTLADGRSVVWGGPSESGKKAVTLAQLMAVRPDASGYDVSSPQAAVVR